MLKPQVTASFKVFTFDGKKRKDITQDKKVSYRVDNELISVKKGKITAGKNEGESVITVEYQGEEIDIPVIISRITVRSLDISASQLILAEDDERELTLTALLSNKTSKDVTEQAEWTSSNPDVLEITKDGLAIARKPGTANITEKYGNKRVMSKVLVVTSKEPKQLRANRTSIQLKKEQTYVAVVTAYYDRVFKEVLTSEASWTSSDPAVATVEDGVITGVAEGKATISISFGGKKVVINVTVKS